MRSYEFAKRWRRERLAALDESRRFDRYRFDPSAYIRDNLNWTPWSGDGEHPGQVEIIEAYTLALRQQFERRDYEAGRLAEPGLKAWRPGQLVQNVIRVEAGMNVGKTKLASGLVNHFFDCFPPAIIYSFAPSWTQIHDLLWKEIKTDRRGKGLPGRVLDLRLEISDNHFATGRATNDAGGKGRERTWGQHGPYLMFVVDEAEGVPDFVFEAIDAMGSGGVVIVLLLANPRTRTSRFHRFKERLDCASFRISCVWHPNVLQDREVIPGAVRRDRVETMLAEHARAVGAHDPAQHTFEVPWRPGIIYQPDPEFLYSILGIAPANVGDKIVIPVGTYEAACAAEPSGDDPHKARIGADMARFGKDMGTIWCRHSGRLYRLARIGQGRTDEYVIAIKDEARRLKDAGVTSLHVRIDGGGGFGGGTADALLNDPDLAAWFDDLRILEVQFGGSAHDDEKYADLGTEMYFEASESLKGLAICDPPKELEQDLCDRRWEPVNRSGRELRKLEPKDKFRGRNGRSSDDGDGVVLCVAPDFLFASESEATAQATATDFSSVVAPPPVPGAFAGTPWGRPGDGFNPVFQ